MRPTTALLTLTIAAAFLTEGLTESATAGVVGNIAAVALGLLLLFRRR